MIPLVDRQVAMSLLLELALQRGTLSHILDAILLLLCLSNMPSFGADKNSRPPKSEDGVKVESPSGGRTGEGGGGGGGQEGRGGRSWRHEGRQMSFPLVHFLRRLGSISTPPSPYPSLKDVQEVGCAWAGWSCVFSSHNYSPPVQQESVPSKCYLECFTLPNDDTTKLDLQQVATVAMAHLDRIAEPYLAFDKVQH